MRKKIFITNGMARSGKDTFAKFLNEFTPTLKYSSIDKVKELSKFAGIDSTKTEHYRKFLCEMKNLLTDYYDVPFKNIQAKVKEFMNDNEHEVMLIDIREPAEIYRACEEFNALSVLVVNDNVKDIVSNSADANVYGYNYDFTIKNNGTLDDLKESTKKFYEKFVKEED